MNVEVGRSEFSSFGVHLLQDWSRSEDGWVWSNGSNPILTLDTDGKTARGEVTLRGMVFSDDRTAQRVTLLDDQGRALASASALQGDIVLKAPVDLSKNGEPGQLRLQLEIAHPTSPKSIGKNRDSRQLGFGLKSIRLDVLPQP